MLTKIFSILSFFVHVYTITCLIYILMSWLPGLRFTKFGRFIASICEPYLGIFRRIRFLQIGNIDFTPILSIGLLSLVSSVLARLSSSNKVYIGEILANVVGMAWSLISSLLLIIFLLIFIRWIILLINKGRRDAYSLWASVDTMLERFVYKVGGIFYKGNLTYQKALLINWITIIVFSFLCGYIVRLILSLLIKLPI